MKKIMLSLSMLLVLGTGTIQFLAAGFSPCFEACIDEYRACTIGRSECYDQFLACRANCS